MKVEHNIPLIFTQKNEYIKDIIKEQGVLCCRNTISKEYILTCLKYFNYGFVILGERASFNQSYGNESRRYLLKGFTLFYYNKFGSAVVDKILYGADEYLGVKYQLLESVYNFIYEKKVKIWIIFSSPLNKSIEFYEDLGFSQVRMIYKNGVKDVCEMQREFKPDDVKELDYTSNDS